MLTRRNMLLAAVCAGIGVPARAADAAAAFVNAIYDTYKGPHSRGLALDGEDAIRRYFEPSLATLIIRDQKAAAKRGEVGSLDFDPFIDAQDWEISDFDIEVRDKAPGRARAKVEFTNRGEPRTVTVDLIRIRTEWRISNITWLHDGKSETLRGLFGH